MNMFYHAPMPSTAPSDSPIFLKRASNTLRSPASASIGHQKLATPAISSMEGISASYFPPHQFADETLLYVMVHVRQNDASIPESAKISHTLGRKLSNFKKQLLGSKKSFTKYGDSCIVRMPRGLYLKYFARDKNDEYVGSEPEREWNEKELEEVFGRFMEAGIPKWVVMKNCQGNVFLEEDRGPGVLGNESETEFE